MSRHHKIQLWSQKHFSHKVFWVLKIGQKKCPKMDFPKKSLPNLFIDTTCEGVEFPSKNHNLPTFCRKRL